MNYLSIFLALLVSVPVLAAQQEFTIVENGGAGQIVGHLNPTLSASAADFRFIEDVCRKFFSIDSTNGTITTSKNIDREEIKRTVESDIIDCRVSYMEQFSLHTHTNTVKITILDQNDNVPRFFNLSQPEVQRIFENVNPPIEVLRLEPLDEDKDENGTTTFNITRGNEGGYFRIDQALGNANPIGQVLFLTKMIQLNDSNIQFNLTVTIRDMAKEPKVFEQLIIIEIINIRDDAPTFPVTSIFFNVSENHPVGPEHIIRNITVSNADRVHGHIEYSLRLVDESENVIGVNTSNGELFLTSSLDYEINPKDIVFYVRASDPTTNLYDEVYARMMIKDANDNSPIFICLSCKTNGGIILTESNTVTSPLARLAIRDMDGSMANKLISQVDITTSDTRIGEIIGYVDNSGSFSLIDLVLNASLDREITAQFTANVTAYNAAEPYLSDSIMLHFTVLDVNDNHPTFPQDLYTLTVAEGTLIDKEIYRFQAYDRDEGENGMITYSIENVENELAENWFRISPTNGILSVASLNIDFIAASGRVIINVSATDNGTEALSSTVRVIIDISPTLTFLPNSYIELGQFDLVQSESYAVYLELRTKRSEGIVFFQQTPSGDAMLLLELKDGYLHLQHNSSSSVISDVSVSDDKWYSVRVQRQNEVTLQVWETLSEGDLVAEALLGATLLGCDNPPQTDSSSLFIGGVNLLSLDDTVSLGSTEFVGAIRNVVINNTQVDLACPTNKLNVLEGFHYSDACSTEQTAFCENDHTAGCVDYVPEPYCKCLGGFPPASCQPISDPDPAIQGAEDSYAPIRFYGNNQVTLQLDYSFFSDLRTLKRMTGPTVATPQQRKRATSLTSQNNTAVQTIEVTFRPVDVHTSVVLHSRTTTTTHTLQINEANENTHAVIYRVTDLSSNSIIMDIPINLSLQKMTVYQVRLVISEDTALLSVDGDTHSEMASDWTNGNHALFVEQPNTILSIGGAEDGNGYFEGCISRIVIDSIEFPLTGLLALSPEEGGFTAGNNQTRRPEVYCDLCDQINCSGNMTCARAAMGEPTCDCVPGYNKVGSECILIPVTGPLIPATPGLNLQYIIIISVTVAVLLIMVVVMIVVIRVCLKRKDRQKRTYSVTNINASSSQPSRQNEYVHMQPRDNPMMTTLCGTPRHDRGSSVSTFQEHAEDADPETDTPQHFSRPKSTVSAESGIKSDTDQETSVRDLPCMEDSGNEKDTDYSASESVSDDLSSTCFPQPPMCIQITGSGNSIPHVASTVSSPNTLTPRERQMLIPLRPPSTALSASEFGDIREHADEDTDIDVFPYNHQIYHASLSRNSSARRSGRRGSDGEASGVSSSCSGSKWYKASTASDTEREKERSSANRAYYSQRTEPGRYPMSSNYNSPPTFEPKTDQRSMPYQNQRRSRKPINLSESPRPPHEKLEHYQFPIEDTRRRDPRLCYDNHRLKHEYTLPKGHPLVALSSASSSSGRPRHNAEAMLASAPPQSPLGAIPSYPRHHSTSGPGFSFPYHTTHYQYSRSYSSESKNRKEPEQRFQDLKSVATINPIAYWEMQDRMNKTAVDQVDPYQILSEPYIQFEDVSTDPSVIESQITQDGPEHQSFCSQGGQERQADMLPPQLSFSDLQDNSTIGTDTELGPPIPIFPSADCSSQYTATLATSSSGTSTPETPKLITLPSPHSYQFDV